MSNFLWAIATSAVVATVVGSVVNEWLDSRRRKHATRFDALSAAVSLEGYAITCAEKITGHNLAMQSAGHAGEYLGSIPDLPKMSIAAGFIRPRKEEIGNRLLVFPQEVRQADQLVSFVWDVTADPDAVREAAVSEAVKLGMQALKLADDIRAAFRLPDRDLKFGKFDVRDSLKKADQERSSDE